LTGAWQDGFACHRSQIIFFWADENEIRTAIESYFKSGGGYTLWKFQGMGKLIRTQEFVHPAFSK